jgi:large subunit ribosomal protein L30
MEKRKREPVSKKQSATVRIRWVQSAIACPEKHKKIVRGLGLRRLQQVVERPDTPAIRGMVAKIPHLVEIVE